MIYLACESMYIILIEATNSRPIIVVLTYYPWTIVTISSSSNTFFLPKLTYETDQCGTENQGNDDGNAMMT